jgi:2-oxoglutarate ferredoxin oxidoreductase subunit alpha
VGEILLEAAASQGLAGLLVEERDHPGACCRLRIDRDEVLSPGDRVDVVLVLSAREWRERERELELAPETVFVEDEDDPVPGSLPGASVYRVPLARLASERAGDRRARGAVLLGALAALFHIPEEALRHALARWCAARPRGLPVARCLEALDAGASFARARIEKRDGVHLELEPREPRLVLSGNEALAFGALAAGCRFFAAAPGGPTRELASWLAGHLPRQGGAALEAADPGDALGLVLGASFAGARAMTATSGPGVSRMSDLLGLASAAEIPCVVVNVQHEGPSTGNPAWTAQGDLAQALSGENGDAPRVVIAPADVEDCYDSALLAFHAAEKYQLPVFILSDRGLASTRQAIRREALAPSYGLGHERLAPGPTAGPFARHALTASGVSPMPAPGTRGTAYRASGVAHDERGQPTTDVATHALQVMKRARKRRSIQAELRYASVVGPEKAALGIIAWGSSKGAVAEAVRELNARGIPVKAIVPQVLEPIPEEPLRRFAQGLERALVVELSLGGQLHRHLAASLELGCELIPVNRPGGRPFSAREIALGAMEVLGR